MLLLTKNPANDRKTTFSWEEQTVSLSPRISTRFKTR